MRRETNRKVEITCTNRKRVWEVFATRKIEKSILFVGLRVILESLEFLEIGGPAARVEKAGIW